MSGDPGFGVYVHWPFCAAKCPYCDFNSHVRHKPVDQARYAEAFATEIKSMGRRVPGRTVSSIFLGGGTPSLMEPKTVGAILDAIAGTWKIDSDVEVTLEANPSSVEAGRFRGYRAAGVNRVSLGVQALENEALKRLGRIHSAAEALSAVETANAVFDRVSFDLIYARPGQTPNAWRTELAAALARASEHLSLYQLTIEEGTPYAALHKAGKLVVPDDDAARALWDVTQDLCGAAGMPAYEISNHALPGAESRHNLVYWRYGEYAGIGPGAHGRLLQNGVRRATANARHPETWLSLVDDQGEGVEDDEALGPSEEGDEFLLMGLRLAEGIDLARYHLLAGRALDKARIADLEACGLVERTRTGRLRVTQSGFPVLDAVVADLAA
jgi:putative oxygen-independent coproporphyrinogen III oxidase